MSYLQGKEGTVREVQGALKYEIRINRTADKRRTKLDGFKVNRNNYIELT